MRSGEPTPLPRFASRAQRPDNGSKISQKIEPSAMPVDSPRTTTTLSYQDLTTPRFVSASGTARGDRRLFGSVFREEAQTSGAGVPRINDS
jgi:hypothetical protein